MKGERGREGNGGTKLVHYIVGHKRQGTDDDHGNSGTTSIAPNRAAVTFNV